MGGECSAEHLEHGGAQHKGQSMGPERLIAGQCCGLRGAPPPPCHPLLVQGRVPEEGSPVSPVQLNSSCPFMGGSPPTAHCCLGTQAKPSKMAYKALQGLSALLLIFQPPPGSPPELTDNA